MSKGISLPEEAISELKAGKVITTCEPSEHLELLSPGIVMLMLQLVGKQVPVINALGEVACKVRITFVSEDTFEDPSPNLLLGLGYEHDVEKFQIEYQKFFTAQFQHLILSPSTRLLVISYERVIEGH